MSQQDYYPFGMVMPGRSYAADVYRYGFQGQEEDEELWSGAVSYKYRVEDPRLGRFFSVDPLAAQYPWNSVYAFSENRLIDGVELEGLEVSKPSIYVEGRGHSTAIDKTGDYAINEEVAQAQVAMLGQHQAFAVYYDRIKKVEELKASQAEIGPDPRKQDAVQQGQAVSDAIGLTTVLNIATGEDINTGTELNGWDYALEAAGGLIELTPFGRILPEAAEKAVIGGLRKSKDLGLVLTNKQARESASAFGWKEVELSNVPKNLQDEFKPNKPIFFDKKTNTYISADIDGHRGDYAWKRFDKSGNRNTIVFNGVDFDIVGK